MSPQDDSTTPQPITTPQPSGRIRPAVRSAIAVLDRWTLTTLNPLDALPRQRTRR
jgi:hypothetical protein